MYSYFEDVFKCAFLKNVVHTHKEIAESLSSISDKDVTAEYRKILDIVINCYRMDYIHFIRIFKEYFHKRVN